MDWVLFPIPTQLSSVTLLRRVPVPHDPHLVPLATRGLLPNTHPWKFIRQVCSPPNAQVTSTTRDQVQVPAGSEAAFHHPSLDRRGARVAAGPQREGPGPAHGGQVPQGG